MYTCVGSQSNSQLNIESTLFGANLIELYHSEKVGPSEPISPFRDATSTVLLGSLSDWATKLANVWSFTIDQAASHIWDNVLAVDAANHLKAQIEITLLLDDNFQNDEFESVANALDTFPVHNASTPLLISILSSTIPARAILQQHRNSFFERVQRVVNKRGELEPGLFDGLE